MQRTFDRLLGFLASKSLDRWIRTNVWDRYRNREPLSGFSRYADPDVTTLFQPL